jgi:hypothetical protein
MNEDLAECPFCSEPVKVGHATERPQVRYIECPGCGPYAITLDAIDLLAARPFTAQQRANASGHLREKSNPVIDEPDLEQLRNLSMPAVIDKAIKLFDRLCVICPNHGQWYEVDLRMPQLRAIAWAQSVQELAYLISNVLADEDKFVEVNDLITSETHISILISPRGWEVAELRNNPPPQKPPLGFR